MADRTYDAVIIGGGNKALLLAMYLIKYGGMTVGIFERRHEIGGCLATEEISGARFGLHTLKTPPDRPRSAVPSRRHAIEPK